MKLLDAEERAVRQQEPQINTQMSKDRTKKKHTKHSIINEWNRFIVNEWKHK